MKVKVFAVGVLALFSISTQKIYLSEAQDAQLKAGTIAKDLNGVEMVFVPAGTFEMGISETQARQICGTSIDNVTASLDGCIDALRGYGILYPHLIDMPAFWIDRYEVTIDQYQDGCLSMPEFIGGCDERLPAYSVMPDEFKQSVLQPQGGVSWYAALIYCNQRGARLPTEEEWEYAASGPENYVYPWGNEAVPDYTLTPSVTYIVGSKTGNVSWSGAFDMIGNVEEWVENRYLPYRLGDELQNGDVSETSRVVRGASWQETSPVILTTYFRNGSRPNETSYVRGFRCARTSDPRDS